MKPEITKENVKKSAFSVLGLVVLGVLIMQLPEACYGGDFINRCLNPGDLFEIILVIAYSLVVSGLFSLGVSKEIRMQFAAATLSLLIGIFIAGIGEYNANFVLFYYITATGIILAFFFNWLLKIRSSTTTKIKNIFAKENRGNLLTWLQVIISGTVLVLIGLKFGWQTGLVAGLIVFFGIFWVRKSAKIGMGWLIALISIGLLVAAYAGYHQYKSFKEENGGTMNMILKIASFFKSDSKIPAEKIGNTNFKEITSENEAINQLKMIDRMGNQKLDKGTEDQLFNRYQTIINKYPGALK